MLMLILMDNANEFAIIHNGIIENYAELKDDLIQDDYSFISETDIEVVVVELSRKWNGELLDTFLDVLITEGTYALVVTSTKQPGTIVAGRMMSPLVLGVVRGRSFSI